VSARRRDDRERLSAALLAAPPPARSFPERPLRLLGRKAAFTVLAALVLALAWSAWRVPELAAGGHAAPSAAAEPIGDFALYARIVQRVADGEGYYAAALAEQRANNYPTRPFVTVRLPTLAWANARLGRGAMGLMAVALLLANLFAWHRALAERVPAIIRVAAVLLVILAGFAAFESRAGLAHELVAGLLVSLALALSRPFSLWPPLLALAAALAVRELALPFALAWLLVALIEKRAGQAMALAVLVALFATGLYLHYLGAEAQTLPGDRASPGWSALLGPRLFLDSLVRFTPLLLLPASLAAPLALLPLLGWIGLGGRIGLLASLWFVSLALVTALFARAENFYWVLMALPAYGAGLALAPLALGDLASALRGARDPA